MEKSPKKVVLLDFWASTAGMRVRIALAEKGVDYEYMEEDFFQKSDLLLRSNLVHKKMPVLLHDGKPICESAFIVQYIDEVWSAVVPLLPADPYQRSQARFWGDYIEKVFWLTVGGGERVEEAKKEFLGSMRVLDKELGDKEFFGGEGFGYVDLMLIPYSCWFYNYERFADLGMEEECPALMAWVRRCMRRTTVANALPDPHKVYDFACFMRKKLGIQ